MPAHSFWDYIKAAFNAKPAGMFVAPNLIGLLGFGLAGFLNPGLWIIGAGLEVGYLLACANSARFRKVVSAGAERQTAVRKQDEVKGVLETLSPEQRKRYDKLVLECRDIANSLQSADVNSTVAEQTQSLSHLVWIYLNLLKARDVLTKHLKGLYAEESESGTFERRLADVASEIAQCGANADLKRSLEGRQRILQERMERRSETEQKLTFTDAELLRIEDQVGLMRDQAALQSDPGQLSVSIDRISGEIKEASTWIKEQRKIYRDLGDALDEPPPAAIFE
jgi:hypothetical protein